MSIGEDKNRFIEIIKGKIKKDLSKYISHGEIIGKKEDEYVKIPIPQIDIPNFRFGSKNQESGVGQGNGQDGDQAGDGSKPGNSPGEHIFETEMSIDDLAQILGEKLELPKIKPKGSKNINTVNQKYNSLAPVGPKGLKHFKSTYKRALKRSIASGIFEDEKLIIPIKDDFKYKAPKAVPKPETKAVVFYIMDVSGSMGDEEKKIVQIETFWINTWLKKHYKGLDVRFIVHDSESKEVKEKEFFTISTSGGTIISTAYELCKKIIEKDYPPNDWNIYVFQFSDGDNWGGDDNLKCISLLKNFFIPIVNSFNYGEIYSRHGSGAYAKTLLESNIPNEKLIISYIKNREGILHSIKTFLGKGN